MAEELDFSGKVYGEKLSKQIFPLNLGSVDFLIAIDDFEKEYSGKELSIESYRDMFNTGVLDGVKDVISKAIPDKVDSAEIIGTDDARLWIDAYIQIATMLRAGSGWTDLEKLVSQYLPNKP